MSAEIRNLEPKAVWENFYQLTQIPRPSKKEEQIIAYMKKFGEELGLKTIVDKVGNVIIKKPATPGMENRKGIVLQGHLDMVPQANSDTKHDFAKDPIDAYVDGEWVTARGTTLGADNGMGVAATMAVLQSTNIPHGPIEALFTIDEETGMTGAFGLEAGVLDGDILMNLDSEDEGELYIGCAGGIDANISLKYNTEAYPANYTTFKLMVKGLKGGHSGMDIILGRGNSNKILFRVIKEASKLFGLKLVSVDGGSLRNAIPRESFAQVALPNDKASAFVEFLAEKQVVLGSEIKAVDPELEISAKQIDNAIEVFTSESQSALTNLIYALPNGVMRMSNEMEGLTETSTNMAIVKSKNGVTKISCLLRSSVDSAKEDLCVMMESACELADAEAVFEGAYPGWKPNPVSAILATMKKGYETQFGKIPDIKAIHAGLECGLLGGIYPNWDMISFGPTIRFPHSPDEKVNIATVGKFWDFLKETLKNAPVK
ncbi:MAG: aminoacyl-histidine dipeptidase [Bacteroidales bacterium]|nr:aminoacyl-histidine dipeptidase [Bacteroidales bacterium]